VHHDVSVGSLPACRNSIVEPKQRLKSQPYLMQHIFVPKRIESNLSKGAQPSAHSNFNEKSIRVNNLKYWIAMNKLKP